MSSFLDNFKLFRYFPQELKQNIKLFHVFDENIAYCVTNDDKVYGFGENICEYLCYYESDDNKSYVLIEELCGKRIEQFFGYYNVFFAISETNEVYSWGYNFWGQLGRVFRSKQYLGPEIIKFFSDKNIIEIYCHKHCLALSSDGKVYGWGSNEEVMLDHNLEAEFILIPILLIEIHERIKSIHSSDWKAFALTFSGRVYCYTEEKYMDWEIPGEDLLDFYVIGSFTKLKKYLQTQHSLYELTESGFNRSNFQNLFQLFYYTKQTTHKTIHLKNNEMFSIDFCLSEDSNVVKKTLKTIDLNETKLTKSSSFYRDLPNTLKSEVKCFYKSYLSKRFQFIVMNNDKVFVIGSDLDGKLALGDIKNCQDLTEIPELSDESIEEFFEGHNYMFARSRSNEIYSWGTNNRFQLGRGYSCDQYLKPAKIDKLSGKNVILISTGKNNVLALTSDGKVFGWGYNASGTVGCGRKGVVFEPLKIEIPITTFIDCTQQFGEVSLAVDINGNAFFWGKITEGIWWQRGDDPYKWHFREPIWSPEKMNVEDVVKVQYQRFNECIVLKNRGKVFVYCLEENKIMREIVVGLKVIDIWGNICETDECVHTFDDENENSIKTNYINFYEYFSMNFTKLSRTIYVKTEISEGEVVKYLTTKEIQLKCPQNILELKDKYVYDRKFHKSFKTIRSIGSGHYGCVYEVMDRINSDLFAIKRVVMKDKWKYNLSETKIMSELKSDFVVQYFDSWVEDKVGYTSEENIPKVTKILYIKMELCTGSLQQVIDSTKKFRKDFKTIHYFICCELLRELTECVNYLHSLSPPVIHRDLKPENVVTTDGRNGVFLKLCDFNITKALGIKETDNHQETLADERNKHTRTTGTLYYKAPEVKTGDYNQKSDMFGLAIIGTQIFNFEESAEKLCKLIKKRKFTWHTYLDIYLGTILENYFAILLASIIECLDINPNIRPNCEEFLQRIDEFSVDKKVVMEDKNILEEFQTILLNQNSSFLKSFFSHKLNYQV